MERLNELFEKYCDDLLSDQEYRELLESFKDDSFRSVFVSEIRLANALEAVASVDELSFSSDVMPVIKGEKTLSDWFAAHADNELSERDYQSLLALFKDTGFRRGFLNEHRVDGVLNAEAESEETLVEPVMKAVGGPAVSDDSIALSVMEQIRGEDVCAIDFKEESKVIPFVAKVLVPIAAVVALLISLQPEAPVTPVPSPLALAELDVEPLAIGRFVHLGEENPATGTEPLLNWAELTPGMIQLDKGMTRIDFQNGPSVTLKGPARLEVVNRNSAHLHRGVLTASVRAEVSDFKLSAESLELVDLGSSFGLSVSDEGVTDVVAFEGEIEIIEKMKKEAIRKRLVAGDAVRRESKSTELEAVPFNTKLFETTWPVTAGVLSSKGAFKFAAPGPWRVAEYEDNENVVVFPERSLVKLRKDLDVDIAGPGKFREDGNKALGQIPEGTRLRSYLLQFNPVGRPHDEEAIAIEGRVHFDRPIVGVIIDYKRLQDTDRIFGVKYTRYGGQDRGLENKIVESGQKKIRLNDTLFISKDMKTLRLALREAQGVDQIRVLVEARPEVKVAKARKKSVKKK